MDVDIWIRSQADSCDYQINPFKSRPGSPNQMQILRIRRVVRVAFLAMGKCLPFFSLPRLR